MSRAFVFPGQGAQTIGMGRALAEAYPAAKAVFAEVDDALGEKLSTLIWEGDIAELTLTQNAQPALMATSIAALRALEAEGLGMAHVDFVAGHQSGRILGALCRGGVGTWPIPHGCCARVAWPCKRRCLWAWGRWRRCWGWISRRLWKWPMRRRKIEVCQAANDNDPAQVVVSGHREAVERALVIAKAKGAKRALMLPVSAPFHCSLMQPAAHVMAEALAAVVVSNPSVPVVVNVRAEAVMEADRIRDLLVAQVTGSVRWRESVLWMEGAGVTEFWEVGAGKALSGMIKRIAAGVETRAIGTPEDIAAAKG